MSNGDPPQSDDNGSAGVGQVPSTDLTQQTQFDERAANIQAGIFSPQGVNFDIQGGIGSYLSEHGPDTLTESLAETQADLESTLGSQYAEVISDELDAFAANQVQFDLALITVTTDSAADPVNHATGQFVHSVTDFSVSGAGIDFAFIRTYKSGSLYEGPLGSSWEKKNNRRTKQ
jgi:hypothetical protein